LFAHKWYIGTDQEVGDRSELKLLIDNTLKSLNDDYAVERKAALKDIFVEVISPRVFYDFLKSKGKEGGQHKFPRVIGNMYNEWNEFVQLHK
jgi:hypothetical protein